MINACHRRGWAYATPSYRLLPEAEGSQVLSDAIDAAQWVHDNVSKRIILAGSSAGGYLALAAAAHSQTPRPLAVLSIYGMLNPAGNRYTHPGRALRKPVENLSEVLTAISDSMRCGEIIDGYAFPENPMADERFGWIAAMHQAAWIPDVLARVSGLAELIRGQGTESIPQEHRQLFPATCGLLSSFPPTALLHGNEDVLVDFEQSAGVADILKSLGVDVILECVEGQGHGFEAKEFIDLDSETNEERPFNPNLRRIIAFLESHVSI